MRLSMILIAGLFVAACRTSPAVQKPKTTPAAVAASNPLIDALARESDRATARAKLAKRGVEAVPLLLANIAHSDSQIRWEVVNLLGAISDARALDALAERAMLDLNPHIRWRSLWALS